MFDMTTSVGKNGPGIIVICLHQALLHHLMCPQWGHHSVTYLKSLKRAFMAVSRFNKFIVFPTIDQFCLVRKLPV